MSVDNPAFAEDDCLLESFERRVVLRDDENRDLATRMTRRPVGEEPVDGGDVRVDGRARGLLIFVSPDCVQDSLLGDDPTVLATSCGRMVGQETAEPPQASRRVKAPGT